MSALQPDLLRACEERLPGPGSLPDLTRRFSGPVEQLRVTALEALFATVREVPRTVSDPGVALAKLAWWRAEVERARTAEPSQHPLVRALAAVGVLEDLPADAWHALLDDAAAQVDRSMAPTTGDWRDRELCGSLCEMRILTSILDPAADPERLAPVSVAARWLTMVEGFGPFRAADWLSLDLIARHGVSSADESPLDTSEPLLLAMADFAATLGQWLDGVGGSEPHSRFLAVREVLTRRRLRRLARQPRRAVARAATVGDTFAAWRTARRVARA
jgi:hypothetical protein